MFQERGDALPINDCLAVAAAAGLHVERLTEGLLRYEYGKEVIGLVTVLRRD